MISPVATASSSRWRRFRTTIAAVGCTAAMAIAGVGAVGAGTAAAAPASPTAGPVCPATTPNAKFVRWMYIQILYRCPDPGGLASWTALLDNGASPITVANAIDMSRENLVDNNINEIYENVLGREPSAAEVSEWLPKFRTEKGDADLTATLASSDEYYNEHCGEQAGAKKAEADAADFSQVDCWLEMLYANILDRDPDEGGVAFYQSILGPNPTEAQRYDVALNYFEISEENARGWVLAAYFAAFNRPPDASGGAYWYHWVLNNNFKTFEMWTHLLGSPEGYAIAQAQMDPPAAKAGAKGDRLAEARAALS